MKMRRIAGLLLTAACAVSLLCPAAWAVNASSVDKSGGNVRLSYRLQMPAVEDSAKIGADVKAQVKTTARRTSNSVVEIGMNSRADAESQLGMKFVSSSTFDALPQGGGTDNVVVSFKPSQKITNTMYNQYRTDGAGYFNFLYRRYFKTPPAGMAAMKLRWRSRLPRRVHRMPRQITPQPTVRSTRSTA